VDAIAKRDTIDRGGVEGGLNARGGERNGEYPAIIPGKVSKKLSSGGETIVTQKGSLKKGEGGEENCEPQRK